MTLKIKNKKLILIVFSLLVIVTIVVFSLFLKGKPDYIIDSQYEEIFSLCLHSEKEMEGGDVSCVAFLEEANIQGDQDWFLISFLTSDFELNNYSLYEADGFVKWNENLFADPEKTYPIHFDFIFSKTNPFKRELESIEISLIEGEELGEIITIINEKQLPVQGLYVRETEMIKERGYDFGKDIEISDGKFLKSVSLLSANIYNISYDNGKFIIDSKVTLNDNEYNTQFMTEKIILSSFFGDDDIVVENATDLENYKEDVLGDILVYSIFNSVTSELSTTEITEYCTGLNDYVAGECLCTYLENIKTGSVSENDINEYINTQISGKTDNFIDLSELLPIYFVEVDDVK